MATTTETARAFFEACETGKGWEGCAAYCQPNASFAAQAEPLAEVKTLKDYADWMKGLLLFMPDGRYEVKSFATDTERNNVCAFGVFSATHSGQGGPLPPTGKRTVTDYVYVMNFEDGKISHMTKIWNASAGLDRDFSGWRYMAAIGPSQTTHRNRPRAGPTAVAHVRLGRKRPPVAKLECRQWCIADLQT